MKKNTVRRKKRAGPDPRRPGGAGKDPNVAKSNTQAALAAALGVSRSSIGYYATLGCPVDGGVASVRAWMKANGFPKAQQPGGSAMREAKLEAELRVKIADADFRRLRVDQMSGRLVSVDAATNEIVISIASWVQLLRRLPTELTTLIPEVCPCCSAPSPLREQLRPEIARLVERVIADMADQAEAR